MMKKKVFAIVKEEIALPVEKFNRIHLERNSLFLDTTEEFEYILNCLNKNEIKITFGDKVKSNSIHSIDTIDDVSRPSQKNRRVRQKKPQEANNSVENSDSSSNDVPSSRSQRAAAQAAGHKLAQVHSFMKATKLRRPSDFDERQSSRNKASSPPPKSRKTHRKQSAGSSNSQDADELNGAENNEVNVITESEPIVIDDDEDEIDTSEVTNLKNGCSVQLEKLTKSVIKTLSTQGSLEGPVRKRKSTDIFDDSISLVDFVNYEKNKLCNGVQNETSHVLTKEGSKKSFRKINNKKVKNEKLVKSDGDLCHLRDADSGSESPLSEDPFKGFDQENHIVKQNLKKCNIILKDVHSDSEVINVQKNEFKQQVTRKTTFISKEKDVTEVEQLEVVATKTKTEVLRKKTNQDKSETNSNKNVNNKRVSSKENISEAIELVTKEEPKSNGVEIGMEAFGKKSDSENESPEVKLRSRTKVLKKNSEVEDEGCRTRTKTLRKGPQCNDNHNLKTGAADPIEKNKKLATEAYKSPAQNKGELVKKRIEDFEKLKSEVENVKEETSGRITRHTARNKIPPPSETQTSRVNRNAKLLATSERARLTPLGTQNRMTPALDSRFLVVNKGLSSTTRQTPSDNNTALVQKQIIDENERKKKEDEILKRKAKEETAKKKKEKTLKATAEETRRKREERLQKVVAAREAAEKEKHLLALKAEKEKEGKLQQIAVEKEKQREEQLKKKQLAHQKALEHEERRKQEEAARLAKLKEQEEEHKRILAMKERELELQKQQKAAELRLAETEKAKYLQHGGKLGKLAAVNNANMKLQLGQTPAVPPNESYEITPAREDRPPIEPKSENDYGIDDANSEDSSDEECKPKKKIPLWAQSQNRHKLLVINDLLPKAIWPLFMECNANPDVNQIFAGNPIKKRLRTSSAVWNTPPRYSSFKYN